MALAATDAPGRVRRAARDLLVVELAQGLVGFVQYFTDLPIALVLVHMLGAVLIAAYTARLAVGRARPRDGPARSAQRRRPPPQRTEPRCGTHIVPAGRVMGAAEPAQSAWRGGPGAVSPAQTRTSMPTRSRAASSG